MKKAGLLYMSGKTAELDSFDSFLIELDPQHSLCYRTFSSANQWSPSAKRKLESTTVSNRSFLSIGIGYIILVERIILRNVMLGKPKAHIILRLMRSKTRIYRYMQSVIEEMSTKSK